MVVPASFLRHDFDKDRAIEPQLKPELIMSKFRANCGLESSQMKPGGRNWLECSFNVCSASF
jgi:hypothetical protein